MQTMRVSHDHCNEADKIQMLSNFLKNTAQLLGLSFYYGWNVEGSGAARFQELLRIQSAELFSGLNVVGHRLRELGVYVESPFGDAHQGTGVFDEVASLAEDLSHRHYRLASFAEEVASLCTALGDRVSSELLNKCQAFHEQSAWLLTRFKG